uniref:Aldehyde ferredoxin oxidoreductase n=1 Tax=Ignisphaera aggregans TaxID=334771 RepID=A0A832CXR8_9CREN
MYRVARIDVGNKFYHLKEYKLTEVLGPIDLGVKIHHELESWKYNVFDPQNALILGAGPFAGSRLFGSHRLVAIFRSPESKGLHFSAMGGVAYKFIGCGVHAITIEGKAAEPTIIMVESDEAGNVKISLDHINEVELEKIYQGYGGYSGAYALESYLLEQYWDFISRTNARPIVVGPAAFKTVYGALVSIDIDYKKKSFIHGREDFAARGGGGSVLAQAHNVVAVIAGGSWKPKLPESLTDLLKLNEFYKKLTGADFTSSVNKATIKYRYDESLGAGGTFGVNYPHYRELLPLFNYNTIYMPRHIKKKLVEALLENFWMPFVEETFIKSKSWETCGEPCPAACKKIWRGKKVDYEPFNALGPFIGILRLDIVAKNVDLGDQLGYDLITLGHVIAWLLEAVYKGLLNPEEIGLKDTPNLDPAALNIDLWLKNAELAKELIINLLEKKTSVLKLVSERGLRAAAKELDNLYKHRVEKLRVKFEDLSVYIPYGKDGYMTPTFYWSPGVILPLAISGKYLTNYTPTFSEPEEFAKTAAIRALKELAIENAGFCRFHRGWLEKYLPDLYKLLGIDVDIDKYAKELYIRIAQYSNYANAKPQYLEGEKAKDVIYTIALEVNNLNWIPKFLNDRESAIKEWLTRAGKVLVEQLGLPQDWLQQ